MRTYKEHYEHCQANWQTENTNQNNLYNILYKENIFNFDKERFNIMCKEVSHLLKKENMVVENSFSKVIKEPKDIPGIKFFLYEICQQIEEKLFNSYFNIEYIHCYQNLYTEYKESSSWLWHFDNCPDEFIKIAFHLNETTEKNGCMKILLDKKGVPLKMQSDRLKPNDRSKKSSRLTYKHIESLKSIGYTEKPIVGGMGSNFVFSPNIVHKATIPAYNSDYRKILMLYVRPYLSKNNDLLANVKNMQKSIDVKEYKLD